MEDVTGVGSGLGLGAGCGAGTGLGWGLGAGWGAGTGILGVVGTVDGSCVLGTGEMYSTLSGTPLIFITG
ncbi:hypothetical protein ASZ90_019084 [hydrocarbon metagenome]|uniref:Uncharacterized protein n=1 Tax=hydrocarbon metagenome TaxID=938273 RepID=A0A0W8E4I9_9ZZZZ